MGQMTGRISTRPRKKAAAPIDLAPFRAATAPGPLWATVQDHPSIWIRWTAAHEEMVTSEQAMTFGNRHIGIEAIGRIVRGDRLGEWMVCNWRPMCGGCHGTGQVEMYDEDGPGGRQAVIDAIVTTMDAGLLYMRQASVECPDCLRHRGWVA